MNGQGAYRTLPETRHRPEEREESKPTLLRFQKAYGPKLKLSTSNNNIFITSMLKLCFFTQEIYFIQIPENHQSFFFNIL